MKRSACWIVVVAAALALVGSFSVGWWSGGHETIAEAAAARLPDDVPAFFRRGGKQLAHFAVDPDRWKNREMTFLRARRRRQPLPRPRRPRRQDAPRDAPLRRDEDDLPRPEEGAEQGRAAAVRDHGVLREARRSPSTTTARRRTTRRSR